MIIRKAEGTENIVSLKHNWANETGLPNHNESLRSLQRDKIEKFIYIVQISSEGKLAFITMEVSILRALTKRDNLKKWANFKV